MTRTPSATNTRRSRTLITGHSMASITSAGSARPSPSAQGNTKKIHDQIRALRAVNRDAQTLAPDVSQLVLVEPDQNQGRGQQQRRTGR